MKKLEVILLDGSKVYLDFTHEHTYPIDIFLDLYHPRLMYKSYRLIRDEDLKKEKQETVEEAAKKYKDLNLPDDLYDAFIAGAKWKEEKMDTEQRNQHKRN